MTKRITFFICLLMLSVSVAYAQRGGVAGVITTADGRGAELVTIALKGTPISTFSDINGKYQLSGAKPGAYTLVVTSIGLQKQEQEITITAGETLTANFVLKENASQLDEVIISTKRNKNNTIAAKMPLKDLENPQVYNSVPIEIIKQQGITSYDDALRNVPGISRTWESTGRAGDGASYFALRGFEAQPTLINGLPGLTAGNLDVANVEEIQVIKGPSATLFGGSFYGYGGIINTITKKPYFDFGGEVTYNTGSFGLNRVSADINTPLSKTDRVALRINTSYHTENSFQDAGFKKSFFIAPSLTYEVNSRLSFNIMTEILEEERAIPPVFFHSNRANALPFKTVKELNLNNFLSFTNNDLTMKNPRFNLQAQMTYKLSDQWTSQTVLSRGMSKSDGYYTYIFDDQYRDNFFTQDFHKDNYTTNTFNLQQNFNGDFKIGNLRNRLLVGLDYYSRNVIDNGSGWATARYVTPQSGEVEFTDPESGDVTPAVQISRSFVDGLLAGTGSNNNNFSNRYYGAYVSDVINITPGLMAMASLRADNFESPGDRTTDEDNFNQFALSQKLGLVYQPVIDKVSIFANYMNAFVNKEPGSFYDADGNPTGEIQSFKPEHANQWEVGVKANLFANKLNATVSYYDIKVSDRVYTDPVNQFNSIQGGKVGSKGFEIDINANLTQGLTLIAGYSHNKTQVLAGSTIDFYNEPGRAPGGQGPQDQVNLWANYKFSKGSLKNFGLGVGGNYASKYRVIDNSVTGTFDLPSYTLLNASVFYNADKYRVTFNVNNLTNEEYYIGYWSINPQRPRAFALSLAYKF